MRIKRSLLIFAALAITLTMTIGMATADEIYVYPGDSIQDAVNNANDGNMILVYPGIYTENVVVNKSLTIISQSGNPDDTLVQAADPNYAVFEVTADNVTIGGFNITGVTGSLEGGIYLKENSKCSVINNFLFNNERGIRLRKSNNNIINNNTAESSIGDDGIQLYYSNNNIISNNNALNNPTGIGIHYSSNNTLTNNTVFDNAFGIFMRFSSNSSLIDNKALNNGIGIQIGTSNNNTLKNNNASGNEYGILIDTSNNNMLLNNIANANSIYFGIGLHSSSYNNTLLNNTANSNQWGGIYIEESSNNNILSNNASSNICGIAMIGADNNTLKNNTVLNSTEKGILLTYSSSNNTIYNNYFNNTNNIESINDYGTNWANIWNTTKTSGTNIIGGPYSGGNFWANPNSTGFSQISEDVDGDGICDSPYYIDENNIDYLPLSETIAEFDPQTYDINEDGTIQKNEVINAIKDYFDYRITKDNVIEVIVEYFRESRMVINTSFPKVNDTFPAYAIVTPDVTMDYVEDIAWKFGLNGTPRLVSESTGRIELVDYTKDPDEEVSVYKPSGAIVYEIPDKASGRDFGSEPNLPSEEDAKRIATEYLLEKGLLPEGAKVKRVGPRLQYGIGGAGIEPISFNVTLGVTFSRNIDGIPVNGDEISVTIGNNSEVVEVTINCRNVQPYREVPIKSPEKAYEDLKSGNTILPPMECGFIERINIDEISMVYWMEPRFKEQEYVLPAYEFRGTFVCNGGESNYYQLVNAVQPEEIESLGIN